MTDSEDKPVFELIEADGHRFAFYGDGRTEGFPPGLFINRFPTMVATARHAGALGTKHVADRQSNHGAR